jgi:hypothetical protein
MGQTSIKLAMAIDATMAFIFTTNQNFSSSPSGLIEIVNTILPQKYLPTSLRKKVDKNIYIIPQYLHVAE